MHRASKALTVVDCSDEESSKCPTFRTSQDFPSLFTHHQASLMSKLRKVWIKFADQNWMAKSAIHETHIDINIIVN